MMLVGDSVMCARVYKDLIYLFDIIMPLFRTSGRAGGEPPKF